LNGKESGEVIVENGRAEEREGRNREDGRPAEERSAFDWVTARSRCRLPQVFKDLRLRVEEDVFTRNRLAPENRSL
jgi:hypothetical protein